MGCAIARAVGRTAQALPRKQASLDMTPIQCTSSPGDVDWARSGWVGTCSDWRRPSPKQPATHGVGATCCAAAILEVHPGDVEQSCHKEIATVRRSRRNHVCAGVQVPFRPFIPSFPSSHVNRRQVDASELLKPVLDVTSPVAGLGGAPKSQNEATRPLHFLVRRYPNDARWG